MDNEINKIIGICALVVDDDLRNTFALMSYLESYGLKILIAENGFKALEILEGDEANIDIILMDMMMPEMDGYETIHQIKENHSINHIPIVAVTAKAMVGDMERCLEAGASAYISKPIDMDLLQKSMIELLNK